MLSVDNLYLFSSLVLVVGRRSAVIVESTDSKSTRGAVLGSTSRLHSPKLLKNKFRVKLFFFCFVLTLVQNSPDNESMALTGLVLDRFFWKTPHTDQKELHFSQIFLFLFMFARRY